MAVWRRIGRGLLGGRSAPPALVDDRDIKMDGILYLDALRILHETFVPSSYLEIGTSTGTSLALASCRTIAVDPTFFVDSDVMGRKPELRMLQTTSAQAFAGGAVRDGFPNGADLTFIDGMHLIEAVLDDFIGAERHASRRGVIVLHDVMPANARVGQRDRVPMPSPPRTMSDGWWTGDVWKMIPILARYRPDLKTAVLDTAPTGLMVITGLDGRNDILSHEREAILREWQGVALADYGLDRLAREAQAVAMPNEGAVRLWVRSFAP